MKKFLYVLSFALVAAPTFAHAMSFEVLGKCGETVTKAEVTDYASETVLSATTKILTKAGVDLKTTDAGYVSSIGGLGESEATVGGEKRLYGWNYKLNGVEPKDSPSTVELPYGQKNSVQWVYGYIRMDLGKTKCVPSEDCPFTVTTAADCEKKAEEPSVVEAPAVEQEPEAPAVEEPASVEAAE